MKMSYVPDVFTILVDRPVGGEFAHSSSIQDRHRRPRFLVTEGSGDAILTVDVGLIVGKETIGIAVE
jgi:hypothetical protein